MGVHHIVDSMSLPFTKDCQTPMKRILIVEDDEVIRELMRKNLESEGYRCIEAENGAAAIEWLTQNQADVVVSDCHMPILGGLELLDWLVEHRTSQLPTFIMISGNFPEGARTRILSLGASAVLNKPFTHNELIATIKQALKTKRTL